MAFTLERDDEVLIFNATSGNFTLNSVAADSMLVCMATMHANDISSITITSESNAVLGTLETGGPDRVRMGYRLTTGSGNKTITFNFTAAVISQAYAAEYSADNDISFDVEATDSGNSATPSVNFTTGEDNSMAHSVVATAGGDASAGSGWTLRNISDPNWWAATEYDLDLGTAGSKTADYSVGSGSWGIAVMAFEESAPPSGGGTPMHYYRRRWSS